MAMARLLLFLYGLACYALFLGVFLYLVGFLANVVVPKGIDDGPVGTVIPALAVNLALIALFGLQHSIMARPGFKQAWTRIVPRSIERSSYVLATSLVLALLYWAWQPLPQPVWQVETAWARTILWGLYASGFGIVLLSTFMTDHFDLFGLRQVWFRFVDRVYAHPPFAVVGFYRFVRHPLYSGLFLAFWATPDMSLGHLVFALGMTVYVLLAVPLEERDLASQLGRAYDTYARRVPTFIPSPGRVHESVRSEESAPSGMR
jgi:protein-S-isoprenylcysteine O-methyltransferase Ste14